MLLATRESELEICRHPLCGHRAQRPRDHGVAPQPDIPIASFIHLVIEPHILCGPHPKRLSALARSVESIRPLLVKELHEPTLTAVAPNNQRTELPHTETAEAERDEEEEDELEYRDSEHDCP